MKYRVLSVQSKEVVDNVLNNGIHYCDKGLMREGSIDKRDIEQCGGRIPIWVYQHPLLQLTDIGAYNFVNILTDIRCEMSAPDLDGLYLFELLLDEQPPKGFAHNDTSLCCVIPCIDKKQVAAIYSLQEPDESDDNTHYVVEPIYKNSDCVLCLEKTRFTHALYRAWREHLPSPALIWYKNAEEYYDGILRISGGSSIHIIELPDAGVGRDVVGRRFMSDSDLSCIADNI